MTYELVRDIDGCTEENCRRCRTAPSLRGNMAHAGIGSYPRSFSAPVALPGQEPVAWRTVVHRQSTGAPYFAYIEANPLPSLYNWKPLYAEPVSPAQERLAERARIADHCDALALEYSDGRFADLAQELRAA